jgi:hypothetical protein
MAQRGSLFVFVFRCKKCGDPILPWLRQGNLSLAELKRQPIPLICRTCNTEPDAANAGEAISTFEVPWSL